MLAAPFARYARWRRAPGETLAYFLSTWLPMTPPTAAPPTVPTVLPPVSTAPATPPMAAPAAVFLSRVDMPLQAPSVEAAMEAIAKLMMMRVFMMQSLKLKVSSVPRNQCRGQP